MIDLLVIEEEKINLLEDNIILIEIFKSNFF